jgi:FlaA1/EpsC-like NDP-sugar epimerase
LRRSELIPGFPRSILPLDYIITMHAIGGFRLARRVYHHLTDGRARSGRRSLIVGAGAAGEQLVRAMRQTADSGYAPIGFIDDDEGKGGTVIQGLRVLGDRTRLPGIVKAYEIEAVLIAIPTAPSREIRQIISLARGAGVQEIRIIPGIDQLLNGQLALADLREVQLNDLLGRDVVRTDTSVIGEWLSGRTVLVTGAGGSIGSELSRQIARFHPRALVLLDSDESQLFWVHQELQRLGMSATAVVADVRSERRVRDIWSDVRPHVVFHAAAYKHVALMEHHPQEAVATNILGTLAVAEASRDAGVEKFVLISTDKAVNPTSVMGATKRVAENVCLALNGQSGTRYIAVRFGNVLGSRGSLLPLFQERIKRGEPLVVRGAKMRRYFMAVEEAVLLVLQAGWMGEGGEVFVLDMGEPVRILDLAREFIRLSGLEPDRDVPIVFADPEPGEKDFEDLLTAEEGTAATKHDRIYVARRTPMRQGEAFIASVRAVHELLAPQDLARLVRELQALVPTYRPSEMLSGQVEVGVRT